MCHLRLLTLTILVCFFIKFTSSQEPTTESPKGITVASWNFHEYTAHITVMVFLLVVVLIKVAFHRIPYVKEYMPESLLLIIVGLIFGAIVRYGIVRGPLDNTVWKLTPTLFFTYLLPPIVLESSYSLYNRTFGEYLGVVLIFAVIGTILNFLLIGFGMYGLWAAGAFGPPALDLDVKGYLLFSALIVAVDPVAVLAIFQDIGVELSLYYIVFGESLLNDAITVVLYDIMSTFVGAEVITGKEIGLGIASFFTVSFGGLLIGVVVGIISCLLTRIENHLNSIILLLLAYFSYIMTDVVGWSGIIAMIGCGLLQAAYAFHNLDRKSATLVQMFTKVVAEVSEAVIFLFLGVEVMSEQLEWHTGFMLWGIVLCLIARTVVVFGITAIVNAVQVDGTKISKTKQLILVYGGLRGAVAFSLAILIVPNRLGVNGLYNRRLIITATLFIILFTVGFMGLTMKSLVKLLKIGLQKKEKLSAFEVLNDRIIDETLAGIEIISGSKGRNAVRDFFIRLDEKYLRKFLQREPETYDHKLLRVNQKIALKLHYAAMQPNEMDKILENVPETLRYKYMRRDFSDTSLGDMLHENWSEDYLKEEDRPPTRERTRPSLAELEERTNDDVMQMANTMRSTRRPSMAPYGRGQMQFDDNLRDVMRSRNRVIEQNYGPHYRSSVFGVDNAGYELNEADEHDEDVESRRRSSRPRLEPPNVVISRDE